MYGEDGEWEKKAAASIEVRIETVKGMGNPKGYPSHIVADPQRWGARERKKRSRKSNLMRTKRIMYHVSHKARLGPSPSSVSRSQTPSQNKPEATVLTPAPELALIVNLQPGQRAFRFPSRYKT